MRGGSLKISLSRCWFCIRCHFLICILFRLGKAGWYCVTKGRSFLRADLFVTPVWAIFGAKLALFILQCAWDWIIQKIKKKKKERKNQKQKKIKIALSLGYPNSYFYNKKMKYVDLMAIWYLSFFWLYNVAAFCQCQCHSSCLRTWSIRQRRHQRSSLIGLQISHICNLYSFLWSSSDILLFYTLHCY